MTIASDLFRTITIPVGALSAGRVECNLAFIDGDGETYSRNVVFLVEPAVSGVFDPGDSQQTRLDKVIGTVQTAADTAIDRDQRTRGTVRRVARIQAADRRARRLSCGRQNHLQWEALYVHLRRLCVDS